MRRFWGLLLWGVLLISVRLAGAQDLSGLELIAHYPLTSDSLDATGKNPPIKLKNAPFRDGGVYCNGVYFYSGDENAYLVRTPQLAGLDFRKFAVQVKFKVAEKRSHPVLVCGSGYRWMGLFLTSEGGFRALYNDTQRDVPDSLTYTLDEFHTLTMVYDSASTLGEWYVDGKRVFSASFVLDHRNERDIGTTHFGTGDAFKGILSDLRVYSLPGSATRVVDRRHLLPRSVRLEPNHPNPFNSSTVVRFHIGTAGRVRLHVFDALGRRVTSLLDGPVSPGVHSVRFDAAGLPSGTYTLLLEAEGQRLVRKLCLLR